MEKVIFLDIDGVLNSEEYFINRQRPYTGDFRRSHDIDSIAIERLNRIMENTNTEIVLSSSWRIFPLTEVVSAMNYKGFKYNIKYVTTREYMDRGLQILKFIQENSVEDYIVLDDEAFDILKYIPKKQFVKTKWKTGLLDSHAYYIIEYFNRK